MPAAVFVVHLDEMQGFIVLKRYPTSFSLTERILNLVYFNHFKGKEDIQIHEIEERRIVTFGTEKHPGWLVCFVLSIDEDYGPYKAMYAKMGRLILEVAVKDPNLLDIGEIVRTRSGFEEPTIEQKCATIFNSPAAILILEFLQERGAEKSVILARWLKENMKTDDISIVEAIKPLMAANVVHVELVQKTTEVVFLMMDLFPYRAPPVEALKYAEEAMPEIAQEYRRYVEEFFSPPPPNKGYNPTIRTDDHNSPLIEDRARIATLLSQSLTYSVLTQLRKKPMTIKEITKETLLPERLVYNSLMLMEKERIAACLGEDLWVLINNPVIYSFLPEYILPIIKRRLSEKEIATNIATRYIELLLEKWSEIYD